ncbi:hypothetical protein GLOTRDRAFT_78065 [Gloeophyllum trabeum ATCC 11539]|uniref:Peptidase S9 prolyl oligopeptidase catalytic domain-containing protein n=1 Tax=Gloeophyllum trabeum (strain ATCC 11539 / FP-39264 / Madison 617) TaxID=670483 RepID=S7Q3V6_GLOTA|nr:uncharacterized protein GLOTRDRAFT_78065 [Gloeophyllum trabeum ATCC 11539]EPQ54128.1 hypothetical protein GLOTRDRAFT_78065 [Gloeophyllum trabeum ATCC 11539]
MAVPGSTYVVGGIVVNVYEEPLVRSDVSPIVLFFLHGRLGSAVGLEPHVQTLFQELHHLRETNANLHPLIIVTFDQRNHGTRLADPKANEAWNKKDLESHNERHAIDMYSIQTGTARDVTFLIDFLPAYIFPREERTIADWAVAGISFGGHSTWIALKSDKRISTGIPIIGCPDYIALMSDRAQKSSVPFEPPYAPESFLQFVRKNDPVSTPYYSADESNPYFGKKVLVLSGAQDKLVPWKASQSFVDKLDVGPQGKKEVMVQEGAGHECTEAMLKRAAGFLAENVLQA